jgi:hypothetical protein
MKVKVIRIADDHLINIRWTDELLEDGTFEDEAEADAAEDYLKKMGRYYVNDEIVLFPV